MRGKARLRRRSRGGVGITPAYAGKSSVRQFYRHLYQDHPRLCGEKKQVDVSQLNAQGSPPPMRGKANNFKLIVPDCRITPAYAGKRQIDPWYCVPSSDHPRLCGEKLKTCFIMLWVQGSPPPMRGKAPNVCGELFERRITPAYAGKSQELRYFSEYLRDHPRLCGEKSTGSITRT